MKAWNEIESEEIDTELEQQRIVNWFTQKINREIYLLIFRRILN